MANMSKAEKAFRAKYPNARVVKEKVGLSLTRNTVYAGDYLCSESCDLATAFRLALQHANDGDITPDPNEVATTVGHPGL